MKRYGDKHDGLCADVYSLAKTLWILLTDQKLGFEGQYNPDGVNGLSRYKLTIPEDDRFYRGMPPIYLRHLDDLLRESTNDNPSERPSIREFVVRLHEWIGLYKDFKKRNPLEWRDTQQKLFPFSMPQRAIWEKSNEIIRILDLLGSIDNLNHMFLPRGDMP